MRYFTREISEYSEIHRLITQKQTVYFGSMASVMQAIRGLDIEVVGFLWRFVNWLHDNPKSITHQLMSFKVKNVKIIH